MKVTMTVINMNTISSRNLLHMDKTAIDTPTVLVNNMKQICSQIVPETIKDVVMSNPELNTVISDNNNFNDSVNMETIVNGNQDKNKENDVQMLDIQS